MLQCTSVTLTRRARSGTHHNVDDEDRNVAERTPARSEVRERLVTWRVDDEQTREHVLFEVGLENRQRVLESKSENGPRRGRPSWSGSSPSESRSLQSAG